MDYCNGDYIYVKENKLYIEKNLLNIDIVNFKITAGIYSSRIAYIHELEKNNINHEHNRYDYFQSADELKNNSKSKLPFKKVFKDYAELQKRKSNFHSFSEEINLINAERPLVGEAYHKLGVDRVRELKYHTGNIKTELIKISDIPLAEKIKELIIKKIDYKEVEDKIIKQQIQLIFNDLNILKAAKATTLNNYFETKLIIRNGKRYHKIIREKIIYDITD